MNYKETVDYLYSQLPTFQKSGRQALRPKMKNIEELCQYLGNPQDHFKSIHIAGTNGKGSSSHFITSILMEAGYKVGLYTSPHLKDYRERFKINGIMIPEDCVIQYIARLKDKIENLRPSFFEVSVAMAFKYFADEKVDIAVIEVGLGGRLDSTNIISKVELSLITNISYDHTDVLGGTLKEIAFQKAGIIKEKVPVVISEYLPETRRVFEEIAEEKHSKLIFAEEFYRINKIDEALGSVQYDVFSDISNTKYTIEPSLTGDYQSHNIIGVIAACEELEHYGYDISKEHITNGINKVIENTDLKGRWQVLGRKPFIVCDTGHNTAAFKFIFNKLNKSDFDQIIYILGFVKDKDLNELKELLPLDSILYLCEIDSPRSYKVEELKQIKFNKTNNISYFSNVNTALDQAERQIGENGCIFIGGSTYLIAELDRI